MKDTVDLRLSVVSPISIAAIDSIGADSGFVDVTVVAESSPSSDSLVLRAAVIEDSIYYEAPNGQTIFNAVFRKFIDDPDGFPIDIAQGDTVRMNLAFEVDADWEPANLSVIVFVQDESTKAILGATSSKERPEGWARYVAPIQGRVERCGYSVTFPSTLFNRGSDTDTFDIELQTDMPQDWSANLAISGGIPLGSSVVLERDSSCTIDVTIECGYEPGTGNARVRAQSRRDPSFERSLAFFAAAGICGLLVDDDGGQSLETYFESALDSLGISYGVWDRSVTLPQTSDLDLVDFTIWFTGSHAPTLKSDDRQVLASYLSGDGRLFITGQDIGYGLCDIISEEHSEESQDFYETYLHASFVQSNSNLFELFGRPGDPISDGLALSIEGGDGANNQNFPDVIDSIAPARVIFDYGDPLKHGGIRYESDSSKVVYLSFGFEAISSAADRITLLSRILNWFGGLSAIGPADIKPSINVYPNPALTYSVIAMAGHSKPQEVKIYDALGRLVRSAIVGGGKTYTWDLKDTHGRDVSPGIYFLKAGEETRARRIKLIILR